jgi:glycine betaine transporter
MVDMRRAGFSKIDLEVFGISVVITVLFVHWGGLATDSLAAVLDFVIADSGWVFILSSFGFLAFSVYLALARYGKIRLGGEDERPEFRTSSWIAMMFSAGMGVILHLEGATGRAAAERGAGAREGRGASHGCPRLAAGAHRGPGVSQLEALASSIGRR